MELRYYQNDAVTSLYTYFGTNFGNPIIALPTGTGKSVVIGSFVRSVFERSSKQRVLMLTHVKELIEQNFDKLLKLWPTAPAGIYSAGLKRKDVGCRITFAGIGSVAKKPELFGHVDLILVDECHLISPRQTTMYQKFLIALKKINPALKVIGFTATPFRLGQGLLTDGENRLFTDICYDGTTLEAFNRFVEEGYIAPLVVQRTNTRLDVSNVGKSGGEFIQTQLQDAVDKDEITKAALQEVALKGAERKHWLIFATGIDHAEHIAAELVSMGIPAEAVHSKMPTKKRDRILRDFKAGKIHVVNNGVLTTGFDFPAIDLIVMLRPTSSPGLWVQMLGRGTRPNPGKGDCMVMDFAGNTARLGPVNDPVLPNPKGKRGGEAPVRCCPTCDTYSHISLRICPECGFEYPLAVKITGQASNEQVMLFDPTKGPVFPETKTTVYNVDSVTYHEHRKKDRPISIRASYFCGMMMVQDWVCLEHPGFAGTRARQWWWDRFNEEPPVTTMEGLERLAKTKPPRQIKVLDKGKSKYKEIVAFID